MDNKVSRALNSKLIEAANIINKNRKATANWIAFDMPKKLGILKVKEWLEEKRRPTVQVNSVWTKEIVEDLNSLHGTDVEKELTEIMIEEVNRLKDR